MSLSPEMSFPLPGKQCKRSSTKRGGIHYNLHAFQRSSASIVELRNCPQLQGLVFSLRASTGPLTNGSFRQSRVSSSTRIATLQVRCSQHSGTNPAGDGDGDGGGGITPYPRTRVTPSFLWVFGWSFIRSIICDILMMEEAFHFCLSTFS